MLLLVMTDGRLDCLTQTIDSVDESLVGEFDVKIIHDDTGDADYRKDLSERFPDYTVIGKPTRQGFGGAIRSAWDFILNDTPSDYVFHLEDDFLFNKSIETSGLQEILDADSDLQQIALLRQPWNENEIAAGGIMQQDLNSYAESSLAGYSVSKHHKFFTTNPSLYRRSLCEVGWPAGEHSEGVFGLRLKERNPDAYFAFLGQRDDPPAVRHIGQSRVGTGY